MERLSPLYECHQKLDAEFIDYARFRFPLFYTSAVEEHRAVRHAAGLFDFSYLGQICLSGPNALQWVEQLTTNDFSSLPDYRVQCAVICNPNGGIIDELMVYRFNPELFIMVVNLEKQYDVVNWIDSQLSGSLDINFEDVSFDLAHIALQGPKSLDILSRLCDVSQLPQAGHAFVPSVDIAGCDCIAARVANSGELGYELICDNNLAVPLWSALLDAGKPDGLLPCGMAAMNSLRLEAGVPLYGREMDETISPLETGLDHAVKLFKEDFIGKSGILERGEPKIKRIGLAITNPGISQERCPVFQDGVQVGIVSSAAFCPSLDGFYAMALVDSNSCQVGDPVQVGTPGSMVAAQVTALPFYTPPAT